MARNDKNRIQNRSVLLQNLPSRHHVSVSESVVVLSIPQQSHLVGGEGGQG